MRLTAAAPSGTEHIVRIDLSAAEFDVLRWKKRLTLATNGLNGGIRTSFTVGDR